VAQNADFLVQK